MRINFAVMVAVAMALSAGIAWGGADRIAFPTEYNKVWTPYLTVDRYDNRQVRVMWADPAIIAKAEPGKPLPHGTVIVMETWSARLDAQNQPVLDGNGRMTPNQLTGLFFMGNGPNWGAEYAPDYRNGEWEYARFNPDGTRILTQGAANAPINYDGCFGCHKPAAGQDYTFTLWDVVRQMKR